MLKLSLKPEVERAARHALPVLLFYSLLFTLFFSPVLFRGSYLAPGGGRLGDALLYHLTYFESPKLFWDGLLGLGLPMTADPQVMAWYPPSMLLSLVPGGWNLFVLAAYVMAACFAYGYVHALTESRLAGFVAGAVYGMSGFMMAHQGHTTIIHVAAWLPLLVWSLEMLRRKVSRGWLAAACAAVACCVLAGHLQMTAYCLLVAACYSAALGWTAPAGRARYYAASVVIFTIGLGLTALQLVPAAELARESTRADFAFADFVSYSFPLKQAVLLLFPASLGGLPQYGTTPYFGAWNLTEVTGYVGLLALLLAAAGFVAWRRKAVAVFWLCVAAAAFLLALGDQTPLARLAYHLPVINKFRAPARHLLEMSFAASVLAGLGASAVMRGEVTRRALLIIVSAGALLTGAGLAVLLSGKMVADARANGVADFSALPWNNAAVGVPLLIFLASAAALVYWHKKPASLVRRALVVSLVVVDLASFGWFYNWRFSYPKGVLDAPAVAVKYGELLRDTNQRVLAARGTMGTRDELPPNLSRLWNVPSANAYGPLVPSRTLSFLSIVPDTSVAPSWSDASDQCLSLAAVRYVFLPRDEEDMNIWLGQGCDHPAREAVRFELPAPVRAAGLRLVSRLACAVAIEDGKEVARVVVTGADGSVQTRGLVAGRDSSEWSYDCPNIRPQVRHGRAEIFRSFPAKMYDESCEGHFYRAELSLDPELVRVVEIQWTGGSGAITIEKLSLVEEPGRTSEVVGPMSIEGGRWRFHSAAGGAHVYENTRAMPRAWLARETLSLGPEDILKAVKTSRLPDGREFDPARTALLEEPSPLQHQGADDATAYARVTQLSDTFMEVETTSSAPAFLVTSDAYYPGWEATLDGSERVSLLRADYALRGVAVPAGRHVVRFDFRPKTFYFGAILSAISLAALAALLALGARRPLKYWVDTGKAPP